MIDETRMIELLKKSGSTVTVSPADFDKPFAEIGIDSLDLYSFLTELEMEFGVKIADEEFETMNTLNDIRAYFAKNGSGA